MSPMPNETLSEREIEAMRKIVAAHDNSGKTTEFDLNNPPKKPYIHQDFPRIVYHHGDRTHKVVNDAKELEAALEDGFEKEPYPAEVPEVEGEGAEPVVDPAAIPAAKAPRAKKAKPEQAE